MDLAEGYITQIGGGMASVLFDEFHFFHPHDRSNRTRVIIIKYLIIGEIPHYRGALIPVFSAEMRRDIGIAPTRDLRLSSAMAIFLSFLYQSRSQLFGPASALILYYGPWIYNDGRSYRGEVGRSGPASALVIGKPALLKFPNC